ncbi:MAG: RNA-binding cell elongation regulator Jag/EloR [Desulfomonilaceae bacterium]
MSSYEFTGKSVKEAIAKACEELNVSEDSLEVQVIEESTRGFLGIVGHRDARIRVTLRPVEPEQPVAESSAPVVVPQAVEKPRMEQKEDATETQPEAEPAVEPEASHEEEERVTPQAATIDEELVNLSRTTLEGILERIPVNAEVVASVVDGAIYLDIRGDGSGLLIGKRGQTLDALQFILSKCINKNAASSRRVEVVVDSENYRQRKRENLRETALKMSLKAKKTLKPVSFNPMPPSERRIVHLILAEDSEVYTKSYGEGPMRRIIVYPRKAGVNKRRRR